MDLTRHPYSESWPDHTEDEFQALRDAISDTGLRNPIILYDGMVLDGWHRYLACKMEGITVVTTEFTGDDPLEFVRDQHTHRSLTVTQRATAIALMHQRRPVGRPAKNNCAPGAQFPEKITATLAEQAGSSVRTMDQVELAIKKGAPELVTAMRNGKVSAKKAEQVAKLPKEQQAAALAAPPAPPKKKSPPPPPAPPEDEGDEGDDGDSMQESLNALSEENDRLTQRLAVAAMEATEEEKATASTLISTLTAENKALRAELSAVKSTRDYLMSENAELKKQCAGYKRKLEATRG